MSWSFDRINSYVLYCAKLYSLNQHPDTALPINMTGTIYDETLQADGVGTISTPETEPVRLDFWADNEPWNKDAREKGSPHE